MKHVGTYEAKNRLSELLDMVSNGEDVVITRHGKPIARLVKPDAESDEVRRARALAAAENIRKLRASVKPLGDVSIKGLINEGRRY